MDLSVVELYHELRNWHCLDGTKDWVKFWDILNCSQNWGNSRTLGNAALLMVKPQMEICHCMYGLFIGHSL